jgi:hypothetical protein
MPMKFILTIVCGVLLTASIWIVTPLRMNALDVGDKTPPLVESGYISKVDLKKKVLTVHGSVVSPGAQPQNFKGEAASSFQAPGGGRGGGGRGRGGGRGGGTPEEELRSFSVYVHPDTVIQNDKDPLTLDELRVQDYVVVLGTAKGKSINVDATSISVSNQ